LPAIGAALIETAKRAVDCREIGRIWSPRALGDTRDPRAFAAPEKRRPGQTLVDFPCWPVSRSAAIWHFYCLEMNGRWWPGPSVVTRRLRFQGFDFKASISGLRFEGFGFHLSHHQPMRELNDKV
jgi:hypothetical protein